MQKKTYTTEDLMSAAREFKIRNAPAEVSLGDDNKVRIMPTGAPGDDDISVWVKEDGKIDSTSPEFVLDVFNDYLHTVAVPQTKPRQASPNVPAKKATGGDITTKTMETLTAEDIIHYFCDDANEKEAGLFLVWCKQKGINPLIGEAYLFISRSKDGTRKPVFIAGKDYFLRTAEEHPKFSGIEAGIIVRPKEGGPLEYREGTFWLSAEEELVGGFAKVYRQDRTKPSMMAVPLAEYAKDNSFWRDRTATMIRKVAMVGAIREAFPKTFNGVYDRDEIRDVEYTVEP